MIEIENEIFDTISKKIIEIFPNINMFSETLLNPSEFPCVCLEEIDNYSLNTSRDSHSNENHAVVVYDINVYSNKRSGKKTECKKIIAEIDKFFADLGFTRTTKQNFSFDNATKYRILARYSAVVSADKIIYRR